MRRLPTPLAHHGNGECSTDGTEEADASGARLTGDPLALAGALRKLEMGTQQLRCPGAAHRDREPHDDREPVPPRSEVSKMFSTHPPMAERIARLEQMAGRHR
ncbi:M48 family metalloprotease [Streptomyces sp. NPDC014889]|uniref:M48 family metalloprotease n=1 Tax=Streptomyces sp. NPDC014889 TaxID=3364928 RepID=UPI0036F8151D